MRHSLWNLRENNDHLLLVIIKNTSHNAENFIRIHSHRHPRESGGPEYSK